MESLFQSERAEAWQMQSSLFPVIVIVIIMKSLQLCVCWLEHRDSGVQCKLYMLCTSMLLTACSSF